MKLVPLQAGMPDLKIVERINDVSFPDSERLPVSVMLDGTHMCLELLGIYTDDGLKGFFSMMLSENCAYIWYFAVAPEARGRGIGSEALGALIERYADRQTVVDFESVYCPCDNRAERARRRTFYLRSGFRETGRFMRYMGTEFEVACSGETFDAEAFQVLLDGIHAVAEEFSGVMYTR